MRHVVYFNPLPARGALYASWAYFNPLPARGALDASCGVF